MSSPELCVLVAAYAQPVFVGWALFALTAAGVGAPYLLSRIAGARRRVKASRFFECAVYSRLPGQLKYDTQALGPLVAFLIYDVDLVFFLAEATHMPVWGWADAAMGGLFLAAFAAGLWYDARSSGLGWAF